MNRLTPVTMLPILMLNACGGGGGGGETAANPPIEESAPVTETTPEPEQPIESSPGESEEQEVAEPLPTSLAEVSVSESFDFTAEHQVEVTVDLSQAGSRHYLSLCPQVEGSELNYQSCVWQGQIEGSQRISIVMPGHTDALYAELWMLDNGAPYSLNQSARLNQQTQLSFSF